MALLIHLTREEHADRASMTDVAVVLLTYNNAETVKTVAAAAGGRAGAALSGRGRDAHQRGRGLLGRHAGIAGGGRAAHRGRALRAARRRAGGRAIPRRGRAAARACARRSRSRAICRRAHASCWRPTSFPWPPTGFATLAGPILGDKADFVGPAYARHRWEGTITRLLLAPLVRALYGRRLQQTVRRPAGALGAAHRSPARAPEVELVGTRRERPLDHRRRHRRRLRGVGGVARASRRALTHAHR